MGKKMTNILSVLLLITLTLGIIGFVKHTISPNENNTPTPTPTPTPQVNNNATELQYSGKEEKVDNKELIVEKTDYIKANTDSVSSNLTISIETDGIKVSVQSSGLNNTSETNPEVIEKVITDVKNPIAVQGVMSKGEGNLVKVYILASDKRVYYSSFAADPVFFKGITTYVYMIDNAESYALLETPLKENPYSKDSYVVFRTTDGSFYTDYNFTSQENLAISKLTFNSESETTTTTETTTNTVNETTVNKTETSQTTNGETTTTTQENTTTTESATTQTTNN